MLNWILVNFRQHSHFVISNIQFIKCVALFVSPLLVAIFVTDDSAQVNTVTLCFLVLLPMDCLISITLSYITCYIRYLSLDFYSKHTVFEHYILDRKQTSDRIFIFPSDRNELFWTILAILNLDHKPSSKSRNMDMFWDSQLIYLLAKDQIVILTVTIITHTFLFSGTMANYFHDFSRIIICSKFRILFDSNRSTGQIYNISTG